jgi:hypothetical protein
VYYARRTLNDPTALLLRNEEVALWPAREATGAGMAWLEKG